MFTAAAQVIPHWVGGQFELYERKGKQQLKSLQEDSKKEVERGEREREREGERK